MGQLFITVPRGWCGYAERGGECALWTVLLVLAVDWSHAPSRLVMGRSFQSWFQWGLTAQSIGWDSNILRSGWREPVEARGCGVAVDLSPHLFIPLLSRSGEPCLGSPFAKALDLAGIAHIWAYACAYPRTCAQMPLLPAPWLWTSLALGWTDAESLAGKITNGQLLLFLQLAQHYPLRFSLSRPEPVNTFHSAADSWQADFRRLDLFATFREFRFISSPVIAQVVP